MADTRFIIIITTATANVVTMTCLNSSQSMYPLPSVSNLLKAASTLSRGSTLHTPSSNLASVSPPCSLDFIGSPAMNYLLLLSTCYQLLSLVTISCYCFATIVTTNDRVRISQVRQRLVSSCQESVSSCPAQTQEAQYAQKKYCQSCIFKAQIFTS